jgi:RND family efflux transporter MFP subunit
LTPMISAGRILALLLLTLLTSGRGQASAEAPVVDQLQEKRLTVGVTRVARRDLDQMITLVAEFRPFQEIDMHAKVAGFLREINVDTGDRVRKGQLLGTLELPEQMMDLQQAEATRRRRAEAISRAQSDLARAESAHTVAHLTYSRLAAVVKVRTNLVAQQDIDEAFSRDQMAEAQISSAKSALLEAKEQLTAASAAADKMKSLTEYARITAPFAGVITKRYTHTGALIQAGTASQTQTMPLVRLTQNDVLRVVLAIPESSVAQVSVGMPVTIRVSGVRRTCKAKLTRISRRVEMATRTMEAEVDLENPDLTLMPGMYAYADIQLEHREKVLVVPVEAVTREEDATTAMVANGGVIETRTLVLGLETAHFIEVLAGLKEGDLVVMGNKSQLVNKQQVHPKLLEGER